MLPAHNEALLQLYEYQYIPKMKTHGFPTFRLVKAAEL